MVNRRNLIKIEEARNQLSQIPIKYPFAESFIKNRDLQEEIARIASERIEVNKEDIIVNCGDMFFHLLGDRHEKSVDFFYPSREIEEICHGEKPNVIHFHGPYLGWQSIDDAISNKHFFSEGANMGCATGIDGIHCRTPFHPIRLPWSDEFYKKLKKDRGITTFSDVKSISCIKKGNQCQVNWYCDVKFKDGKGHYFNIFNEVDYEKSIKGDKSSPYQMLENVEGKCHDDNIIFSRSYNEVYDDSDQVYCSVVEARNETKRILSCFKTTIA